MPRAAGSKSRAPLCFSSLSVTRALLANRETVMLRSILRSRSFAQKARRRRILLGHKLVAADIHSAEVLENRWLVTPLAPANVVASGISASAIALNWQASTDPTVKYDVYQVTVVVSGGGKGSRGSYTV